MMTLRVIFIFFSLITLSVLAKDEEMDKSSELSWVSNFAGFSLPKNCHDKEKLEEWANKRKQVPFGSAGKVVQVIMSSKVTDDMDLLLHSAEEYGYPYIVIGLGQKWRGLGDKMTRVRDLLRLIKNKEEPAFQELSEKWEELIILFTDAWDVLMVNKPKKLLTTYETQFPKDALVFMAESTCWPDDSLEEQYPQSPTDLRFLNSGVYISPANKLLSLFESEKISDHSFDDQLYYTLALFTRKYNIHLDYHKLLFGSLYGFEEITEHYTLHTLTDKTNRLHSTIFDSKVGRVIESQPIVVHGHGPTGGESKNHLRMLQNFFPSTKQFPAPHLLPSPKLKAEGKKVLLAVYLFDDLPFPSIFFDYLEALNFDKQQMVLWINYDRKESFEIKVLEEWIEKSLSEQGKEGKYSKVVRANYASIAEAKYEGMRATLKYGCDYYFTTDCMLTNKNTLQILIEEDKRIITPLIVKDDSTFSNFWAAVGWPNGGYKAHPNYHNIVNRSLKGVFGVPVTWGTYLVKVSAVEELSLNYKSNPKFDNLNPWKTLQKYASGDDWWVDIAFATRSSTDSPLWLSNRENFGFLVEREPEVTRGRLHKELYLYEQNKNLWKKFFTLQTFTIT